MGPVSLACVAPRLRRYFLLRNMFPLKELMFFFFDRLQSMSVTQAPVVWGRGGGC